MSNAQSEGYVDAQSQYHSRVYYCTAPTTRNFGTISLMWTPHEFKSVKSTTAMSKTVQCAFYATTNQRSQRVILSNLDLMTVFMARLKQRRAAKWRSSMYCLLPLARCSHRRGTGKLIQLYPAGVGMTSVVPTTEEGEYWAVRWWA